VLVWEPDTGKVKLKLESEAGHVHRLAFSPDGTILASASDGNRFLEQPGEIRFWDLTTGKAIHSMGLGRQGLTTLRFSPDGKVLAVAVEGGPVQLLDTRTGQQIRILDEHTYYSAAFSHDGKFLLTTGGERGKVGTIWVWEVATGKPAFDPLLGHGDIIHDAVFSPDDRRIVSAGGEDGTIRVWDVAGRQEILELEHRNVVDRVAFSKTGNVLVSSSGSPIRQGFTRIWKAIEE
jgi:WD40 repeat protein